jgi:DNA-binding SARP family transcriptional activator
MSQHGQTEVDQRTFTDAALALDLVDHYPHAILVQDPAGRLVAHNRAADELLGHDGPLRPGSDIGCRIVGCRSAAGGLSGVCLHQRALRHDGPPAALHVELPDGASASATLVALAPARELIVTELRRVSIAAPDAREAATFAPPADGVQLRVFALGRTRVMNGAAVLDGRWLNNRAGHILKLLVTERDGGVFSDEIVGRLWPTTSSPDTRGLRYFVHVLRERLEPDGSPHPPSSFIRATRGGSALDADRVWVDADAFEQLIASGLSAAAGDDPRAAELLRRGLDLYRGEFLADEPYAEWALHERDRLRDIAGDGLRALAALDAQTGDLARSAASLTRLAELEPFDVDVHRELFSLLLRRGRRSEALRRYETLRRRMLSTFDEPLDFSLSELM